MKILVAVRRLRKASVIVLHEGGQKRIAGLDVGDPGQAHLLDQTVLQGAVGPVVIWISAFSILFARFALFKGR